jgi:hypothetical protein
MLSPLSVAANLSADHRKHLAIQTLARTEPVSRLAARTQVSRKFLYRQKRTAETALNLAFAPAQADPPVLFHLPVTAAWLDQLVVSLVLICHSSYRGVIRLLQDLFDTRISLGDIHNLLKTAAQRAAVINASQDLSPIRVGLHDEIFQGNQPVLAGVDAASTYCYLLVEADHRDGETWGVHLLDAKAQGFTPDYTIADAGAGLRAGQRAALGNTPCHGDVFHIHQQCETLVNLLARRAQGATTRRHRLEQQMAEAKLKGRGNTLSLSLAQARQAETVALSLAQDVKALTGWLERDILALAGPCLKDRRELFDFIVAELKQREPLDPARIRPVRIALTRQRESLLGFAKVLDGKLTQIAQRFQVPDFHVRAVCLLQRKPKTSLTYWQRRDHLNRQLGWKFHAVLKAVVTAMDETPRSSSLVENLNGRLRCYFFLRRNLGQGYLDLLRFFLNHRTFSRSDRPERVGKSPAELMTGKSHPHWLELLGFERFRHSPVPA